ncbi:MAG: hypothetical protein Q9220_000823 [cf. Caloplaca sp. 1 TL-2023]
MEKSTMPDDQPPAYSEVVLPPKVNRALDDETPTLLITSGSLVFGYHSSLASFDISISEWNHFTSALSSSASLTLAEKSKAVAAGVALGAVSGWPWLGVGVGKAIWRNELKVKVAKGDVAGMMQEWNDVFRTKGEWGMERVTWELARRQEITVMQVQIAEDVERLSAVIIGEDVGNEGDAVSGEDAGREGDVGSRLDVDAVATRDAVAKGSGRDVVAEIAPSSFWWKESKDTRVL